VLSVVAEVVCAGDVFEWVPGEMERPSHRVDWFGERGEVLGAYAYAVLVGNATSKVAVVGPQEIARAKAAAESPDGTYSPWRNDYAAMVRKTALRRLDPFVPKASEVTAVQQERTAVASDVAQANDLPELPPVGVDQNTGEVFDAEVLPDAFPDQAKP
jgi:recombination protein RecT